jgi:hypothetical protein
MMMMSQISYLHRLHFTVGSLRASAHYFYIITVALDLTYVDTGILTPDLLVPDSESRPELRPRYTQDMPSPPESDHIVLISRSRSCNTSNICSIPWHPPSDAHDATLRVDLGPNLR